MLKWSQKVTIGIIFSNIPELHLNIIHVYWRNACSTWHTERATYCDNMWVWNGNLTAQIVTNIALKVDFFLTGFVCLRAYIWLVEVGTNKHTTCDFIWHRVYASHWEVQICNYIAAFFWYFQQNILQTFHQEQEIIWATNKDMICFIEHMLLFYFTHMMQGQSSFTTAPAVNVLPENWKFDYCSVCNCE